MPRKRSGSRGKAPRATIRPRLPDNPADLPDDATVAIGDVDVDALAGWIGNLESHFQRTGNPAFAPWILHGARLSAFRCRHVSTPDA